MSGGRTHVYNLWRKPRRAAPLPPDEDDLDDDQADGSDVDESDGSFSVAEERPHMYMKESGAPRTSNEAPPPPLCIYWTAPPVCT